VVYHFVFILEFAVESRRLKLTFGVGIAALSRTAIVVVVIADIRVVHMRSVAHIVVVVCANRIVVVIVTFNSRAWNA